MHERRHWADNPELILHVLRLRFDKALSYLVISAQTGVSKAAIFFSGKVIIQITPVVEVENKIANQASTPF